MKWVGYRLPAGKGREVVAEGKLEDEERWSERLRAWFGYSKEQVQISRIILSSYRFRVSGRLRRGWRQGMEVRAVQKSQQG